MVKEIKPIGLADSSTVHHLGNQKPPSISQSNSDSVILQKEEAEQDEFEWVAVDRELDVAITDKSPEIEEVEDAFSALQLMFNDDEESEDQVSELEVIDWIEPPLQLCTSTRLLQPYMMDRLYDAFHLFQTDPSVQRMVMSLTSDKAVWDAVMNNEVVRELITNVEGSGEEDSGCTTSFMRRLFERSTIKIIDAMERVTKYVTDLFNVVPGDETVVLATGPAPVMEKLQMTVLLAIVVLLVVFVTRDTRAR